LAFSRGKNENGGAWYFRITSFSSIVGMLGIFKRLKRKMEAPGIFQIYFIFHPSIRQPQKNSIPDDSWKTSSYLSPLKTQRNVKQKQNINFVPNKIVKKNKKYFFSFFFSLFLCGYDFNNLIIIKDIENEKSILKKF
jgi:hypothetical protein